MRQGAATEHLAQLVRPPRPRFADDVGGVRRQPAGVLPLEQEGRDRLVELLILLPGRPDHVVVDPPQRHRREDRPAGLPFAPAAEVDQQRPLGLRVELPHAAEQLGPRRPGKRLRAKHQRHVLAGLGQQPQLHLGLLRRPHADDPVAACVAIEQLGFDRQERPLVFVDGEDDGTGQLGASRNGRSFRSGFLLVRVDPLASRVSRRSGGRQEAFEDQERAALPL